RTSAGCPPSSWQTQKSNCRSSLPPVRSWRASVELELPRQRRQRVGKDRVRIAPDLPVEVGVLKGEPTLFEGLGFCRLIVKLGCNLQGADLIACCPEGSDLPQLAVSKHRCGGTALSRNVSFASGSYLIKAR